MMDEGISHIHTKAVIVRADMRNMVVNMDKVVHYEELRKQNADKI